MVDETVTSMTLAAVNSGDEIQLTMRERCLIGNFRAMKRSAQDMMIDTSEQYKRTLPAAPVKLTLLRLADKI